MGGPVVGRDDELRVVDRWLDGVVTSGVAAVLLVEGEAGIGKTRLVTEAIERAGGHGVQLHAGSAHELERSRPFGALSDALGLVRSSPDPERAHLAHLLLGEVEHSRSLMAGGPSLQYLVSEGVVGIVEAMTAVGPLLLVLEDLHWADPSTLAMVATLTRRLSHLPLALLTTCRPVPKPPELERLLDVVVAAGASRLWLDPLDDQAVDALVTAVAGAAPGPRLRFQLAKAQGHPLYVLELLSALREERSLAHDGAQVEISGNGLPADLRTTLLRRLTYLGSDTVELLRAASVLGTSWQLDHLGVLLGRSALDLANPIRQLVNAGVLREDGGRLAFRHDLIREAIYDDLPRALRDGMHTQVGRALAEAGAPPLTVAGHLRVGARVGDRDALQWLHAAGTDALSRDPAIAVELLSQAIDLTEPDDAVRDGILADLVQARLWSGDVGTAEKLAREVLARPHDTSRSGHFWTALILALLGQARAAEADLEARRALEQSEVTGSPSARLRASAAQARGNAGDVAGAELAAKAALRAAEQEGDDLAAVIALCAMALAAAMRGNLAATLAAATDAAGRATRTREAGHFVAHLFLGYALNELDRQAEAAAALDAGRRLSEDLGSPWVLAMYYFVMASVRLFSGEWDDAVAEIQAGLVLADEVGTRHGVVPAHAMLAFVHLQGNDLEAVEQALGRGDAELAAAGPGQRGHWLFWARGLFEEARGDTGRGLTALEEAWSFSTAIGAVCEYPLLGPDLVRLCRSQDRLERSREIAQAVEVVASRMGTPWSQAAALRCRGLSEEDGLVLEQAVAMARQSPRPLPLAAACEEAGTLFAGTGPRERAVPLLEEALSRYETLGAVRDASRVEAVLRSLGVRRGRRGSRPPRPATGWDALTPTEAEVARLVAGGATNREAAERLYVSARTVETHVSHVLAKLEVSSRAQLAAVVIRREAAGQPLRASARARAGAGRRTTP